MSICIGCGKQNTTTFLPVAAFSESNFMFQDTTKPWNEKRLIYIHGGQCGDHFTGILDTPEYAKIETDLVSNGWQVVMFDRPCVDKAMFNDGGLNYRNAYKAKLDQVIAWANQNYGIAKELDVAGISYGGLHALMALQLEIGAFAKYVVITPVTHLGALTEFNGMQTPYFDPELEYAEIAKIPGYITYSSNDTRVNTGDLTQQLISKLGNAPILTFEFIDAGHGTNGKLDFLTHYLEGEK